VVNDNFNGDGDIASGKLQQLDPENNPSLVETNLPTPIWQGLY
jgi:hypothetical protein